MRELLRSNDLVHLSWARAMLAAEGIDCAAARRPCQRRRGQHRGDSAPPDGRRGDTSRGPSRCSSAPAAPTGDPASLTAGPAARRPGVAEPAGARLSRGDRPGAAGGRGAGARGRAGARCRRRHRRREPCALPCGCRAAGSSGSSCSARCSGSPSRNVGQNELGARVEMLEGDLVRPPPRFAGGSFDHVMTNPPHLAAAAASALAARGAGARPCRARRLDWRTGLRACLRMLRPGGVLTLIHRAERLGRRARLARRLRWATLVVFPLWPGQGPAGQTRAGAGPQGLAAAPLGWCPAWSCTRQAAASAPPRRRCCAMARPCCSTRAAGGRGRWLSLRGLARPAAACGRARRWCRWCA